MQDLIAPCSKLKENLKNSSIQKRTSRPKLQKKIMIFQVSFIFFCFPSWVWPLKPAKTWKFPDRLAAPTEKRAPNFCNLPWEISGRSCFTCFPSWFSTKMPCFWRHDTAWRLMGDYKNWVCVWRQSMRELIFTFLRFKACHYIAFLKGNIREVVLSYMSS